MRRQLYRLIFLAATLAALAPLTALGNSAPRDFGPPVSTTAMSTSAPAASSPGDATPQAAYDEYDCSVEHGLSGSNQLASSYVEILNCTENGFPATWTGTGASTQIQEFLNGAKEWTNLDPREPARGMHRRMPVAPQEFRCARSRTPPHW